MVWDAIKMCTLLHEIFSSFTLLHHQFSKLQQSTERAQFSFDIFYSSYFISTKERSYFLLGFIVYWNCKSFDIFFNSIQFNFYKTVTCAWNEYKRIDLDVMRKLRYFISNRNGSNENLMRNFKIHFKALLNLLRIFRVSKKFFVCFYGSKLSFANYDVVWYLWDQEEINDALFSFIRRKNEIRGFKLKPTKT